MGPCIRKGAGPNLASSRPHRPRRPRRFASSRLDRRRLHHRFASSQLDRRRHHHRFASSRLDRRHHHRHFASSRLHHRRHHHRFASSQPRRRHRHHRCAGWITLLTSKFTAPIPTTSHSPISDRSRGQPVDTSKSSVQRLSRKEEVGRAYWCGQDERADKEEERNIREKTHCCISGSWI